MCHSKTYKTRIFSLVRLNLASTCKSGQENMCKHGFVECGRYKIGKPAMLRIFIHRKRGVAVVTEFTHLVVLRTTSVTSDTQSELPHGMFGLSVYRDGLT